MVGAVAAVMVRHLLRVLIRDKSQTFHIPPSGNKTIMNEYTENRNKTKHIHVTASTKGTYNR